MKHYFVIEGGLVVFHDTDRERAIEAWKRRKLEPGANLVRLFEAEEMHQVR